jgi:hypothetical protein
MELDRLGQLLKSCRNDREITDVRAEIENNITHKASLSKFDVNPALLTEFEFRPASRLVNRL